MPDSRLELNEDQVVRQAIQGDQEAFARLYDVHADEVFRFVKIRVRDQHTAEDITSSVFLKAWENLSGYKIRKAPFQAWLFRIARNAVIDHYRTEKEHVPLEAAPHIVQDRSSGVPEKVVARIQVEKLAASLTELTEDQRNVLILKLVQGYSIKEVAKALGKREGAVRALQMRALQSLSKLMESKLE